MKEFFFGWLFKPALQVSAMDKFVEFSEVFLLLGVSLVIIACYEDRRARKRKTRP